MALDPIDSDALDGASYDPRTRTLTVSFESGGVYEYYEVDPELVELLERSQPHPWSVVGEDVRAHRFRRIG
ncbi:KTSC domain-containing protein [Compostimonas suwonensis]|uniref:KTSC domain-containing protein n=1 Tax=Compostimonas suwonensis TaxID=1048394 RepID=A0A2M9BB83_9MICO|nr:KTSC domain-containing protein [Compostimonas suwonensis]PJJ55201.1 KTSC domain-containing protein [Compostimonas suwonensis]